MASDQSQAVSGLRIMVAVAKADGHFTDVEARQIAEAVEQAGVTPAEVFGEPLDLEAEIAKVTDPDVRLATYRAAVLLSMADGEAHPEESKALARLRAAFDLPDGAGGIATVLAPQAIASEPRLSEEERKSELRRKIGNASFLAAVLGANPIPGLSVFTDIGIYWVQWDVVRHVGHLYGHKLTTKEAVAMFAGTFGLNLARSAAGQLLKFVPGWGSALGAAAGFTTTYALGHAVWRHFESGGTVDDLKKARASFDELKKGEAKERYEASKTEIEAKAKTNRAEIEQLARDMKSGKVTASQLEDVALRK